MLQDDGIDCSLRNLQSASRCDSALLYLRRRQSAKWHRQMYAKALNFGGLLR